MAGPHVVLHPAGSPAARAQFDWTVAREVDFRPYAAPLGKHLNALLRIAPHGDARIWGVCAAPGSQVAAHYERLADGDVVLYLRDGTVIAGGRVAHRWAAAVLARRLWGAPPPGQEWIGLYALDRFCDLDVPVVELNAAAGYAARYRVPGFRVLDDARSSGLLEALSDELRVLVDPSWRPRPERARRRAASRG